MALRPSAATMRTFAAVQRRQFSTTPVRQAGYHYPEGPRSNLPFNPLTRFFYLRYWGFCAVGFGLPFGIAVWQTKKKQFL